MCNHSELTLTPSIHAILVGYARPTSQQRASATTTKRQAPKKNATQAEDSDATISVFPAPLILPGDDLSLDPKYPPQSLLAWKREKERNEVTESKNVIYIAGPPGSDTSGDMIQTWAKLSESSGTSNQRAAVTAEDVLAYLSAFYHGMQVKPLPTHQLCFTSWETKQPAKLAKQTKSRAKAKVPPHIGLKISSEECVQIRTRISPDSVYTAQLNLDDLLDAAIGALPEDAYALLLLVEHDLFEDDDDEFVCGRAYGGSRVAVVSTARYNPCLDVRMGVNVEHSWPASHCSKYVEACCRDAIEDEGPGPQRKKRRRNKTNSLESHIRVSYPSSSGTTTMGPIQTAIHAYTYDPLASPLSITDQSTLWLSRICRTAAHELGHCFGIDHCAYYACSMQGSASLAEDARQPPYLCPVDLAKVLTATGADETERYHKLLAFCDKFQDGMMFGAFGGWLARRVGQAIDHADRVA